MWRRLQNYVKREEQAANRDARGEKGQDERWLGRAQTQLGRGMEGGAGQGGEEKEMTFGRRRKGPREKEMKAQEGEKKGV